MERIRTMIFFCVYEEIDMDQKLAFHIEATMRLLKFLNIYEVFIVQEARSSPKSALNMVHDHAFRTIITKQPSWHTLSAT